MKTTICACDSYSWHRSAAIEPLIIRSLEEPPSAVWPWIVRMAGDRGGFCSNTWLENPFGSGIHNAQRGVAATKLASPAE